MSSLLPVSLWQSGRISVSHTGDKGFEHSDPFFEIKSFCQ